MNTLHLLRSTEETPVGTSALRRVSAALLLSLTLIAGVRVSESARFDKAPEFPSQQAKDWIGAPQSMKSLAGKVVLIDVWTFMCINCQRTVPWILELEKRYAAQGLVIVGVHTPEFERERSRTNVEAAVKELGLQSYSHFLDNRMTYWRALQNEYWPAVYVIDRKGQIRNSLFGEIHIGTGRDRDMSGLIEKLLSEPAPVKP